MKTALIILSYNDGELSSKLADQVKDYPSLDHLVLVNNQSTDNTLSLLKAVEAKAPEKVTVVTAPENGGYAKGNNFGMRYAIEHFDADLLFVANPDTFFTDQTIAAMKTVMEKHPGYGLTAPVVNQGYNAWNLPGFAEEIESLFLIIFNLHKKAIKSRLIASGKEVKSVGVVEGSFFAISRKAYEQIGGMDERTFIYGEDNMMSYRLMLNDLKVGILTKERYDHL
ncbi:MAG: glycosyltransferase family 2 protein, partial [Lachnospiraceae bacterium]|nr:glycosyltransferase family 2 protein [Lachnospiraceae bacterium]